MATNQYPSLTVSSKLSGVSSFKGGTSIPLKNVGAEAELSDSDLFTRRFVDMVWSDGEAKVGSAKSEINDHVRRDERILAMVQGSTPRWCV